jgi:hypothetical protein
MAFDLYNNTATWFPDPAVNISWLTNITALPESEDWSTPSSGTRRRHHPYLVMAWWQQLGWSALFALMLLVAAGGNAIVLWIVLGELPSCFSLSSITCLFFSSFCFLSYKQTKTYSVA